MNWHPLIPYQVVRDFAGPFVTFFAACVAAWITWTFSARQTRIAAQQAMIARQQAETTLDQLRFNLFERRAAILDAARELIWLLLNTNQNENIGPHQIVPLYAKMRESRIYFSSRVSDALEKLIQEEATSFLQTRNTPGSKENLKAFAALVRRMEDLPALFEPELRFERLTSLQTLPR